MKINFRSLVRLSLSLSLICVTCGGRAVAVQVDPPRGMIAFPMMAKVPDAVHVSILICTLEG